MDFLHTWGFFWVNCDEILKKNFSSVARRLCGAAGDGAVAAVELAQHVEDDAEPGPVREAARQDERGARHRRPDPDAAGPVRDVPVRRHARHGVHEAPQELHRAGGHFSRVFLWKN